MDSTDITKWDKAAREHFVYSPDGSSANIQYLHSMGLILDDAGYADNWLSHADEVLEGKTWRDDCDGLTSTVVDLCARAGSALSSMYFLVVLADPGDGTRVGHMVGCVQSDAGDMLIVGDTFETAPYPAGNMKHLPVDYHRMSENIRQWRGGVPWTLVPLNK